MAEARQASTLKKRNVPMDTQKQIAPEATSGEPPNELSRRTVLAGVAATTVAAGVTGIDVPANAAGTDPRQDMIAFIFLSAALTGIAENKLSNGFGPLPPGQIDLTKINPGSDPVDIKKDYFNHVMGKDADGFQALLKIARDNVNAPDREKAIIDKVQSSDRTRYLARSIVLLWYLGGWYDPKELQRASNDPNFDPNFKVISSKAYTQSWATRVARAHPMGFSQGQFGYWHETPNPLSDYVGGKTA
jgi:hypothetical protein